MAHIVVTYDDIERIFKPSFSGRRITNVKKHPFLVRSLMVEFPDYPGDEFEVEWYDEPTIPLIDEVIETTIKKGG